MDFDSVVIGAGVVGLAIARSLSNSGRKVLLLEGENAVGQGISSRSSEVIHAGIYYPRGSLKRDLCLRGRISLIDYCKSNNVEYKILGKLIVANTEEQVEALSVIIKNGIQNGVSDLKMISEQELEHLEPSLRAKQAILSPSTGIIDSYGFMLSLQSDFELSGGLLSLGSSVSQIRKIDSGFAISVVGHDGFEVTSRELINSTGLNAQALSSKIGGIIKNSIPNGYFCKGTYFSLASRSPFSKLIYPVPNSAGLGVHLTLDLAGRARFGPDVEWINTLEYEVSSTRKNEFYEAIRQYYPAISKDDLNPDYAGVRPKLVDAGKPAADFMIQLEDRHALQGYVALYGIESPGLTASLSIAHYVRQSLG